MVPELSDDLTGLDNVALTGKHGIQDARALTGEYGLVNQLDAAIRDRNSFWSPRRRARLIRRRVGDGDRPRYEMPEPENQAGDYDEP